jgi:hypothetical protein
VLELDLKRIWCSFRLSDQLLHSALMETELNLTELKLVHNHAWGKKYFGNVRGDIPHTGFKSCALALRKSWAMRIWTFLIAFGYQRLWFSLNHREYQNHRTKGHWE